LPVAFKIETVTSASKQGCLVCRIFVKINEKEIPFVALIDTGAAVSVLNLDYAENFFVKLKLIQKQTILTAAGRHQLPIFGSTSLKIRFYSNEAFVNHNFITTRNISFPIILGSDFLTRIAAQINCSSLLMTTMVKKLPGNPYDIKPVKLFTDVDSLEIEENIKLKQAGYRGNKLGLTVHDIYSLTNEDRPKIKINPSLPKAQQDKLWKLLLQYPTVFAWDISEIGKCNLRKYHIDTQDSPPIAARFHRKSTKENEIIQAEVQKLLDAGIIQPSQSPWAANPLIVPKKEEEGQPKEYRMVVSYKKLNNVTVKDKFPMARIDDILFSLNGAKFFCKLDLFSGYFQIEIDECCKPKTAFMTSTGLYEYNYLSFGMCNAPSEFNRVMRMVLAEVLNFKVLCYMDDIIVFGKDFEDLLQNLGAVLDKLKQHNMTLKPSKCVFGTEKISVLGHEVSREGIHCDPEKLSAIQQIPQPTRVKHIRSLLGLTGYYRHFISGYAQITKPLRGLLKKYNKFVWTSEHQEALDRLKAAMCNPPVLVHFDPDNDKIIATDASLDGIGGALLQPTNGKDMPVAYVSRSLSPAEANYSATELECLAVVYAVEKFRQYIFEQDFTIRVDHHALCALTKMKEPNNARLVRWQLKLEGLRYKIEYTKGSTHHLPDCLSRLPCTSANEEDETELQFYPVEAVHINFKEAQHQDPSLVELMKNPAYPYCMKDGILFRENKPVVPKDLESYLLHLCHDDPMSGHLGIDKTFHLINSRYYMRGCKQKVIDYVNSCLRCQMRKPAPHGPYGETVLIPTQDLDVMSLVFVDVTGPFTTTSRGNQYIIVAVEYVTRFVMARAIRTVTSESMLRFLLEDIVSKLGLPHALLTDNATVFTSELFKTINQTIGIKKIYSTPYHSQGNALCERQHRTIQDILSKFISSNQKDWDVYLPMCIFAMNNSVQTSTKFTPFYLMFHRESKVPCDNLFDNRTVTKGMYDSSKILDIYEQAKRNLLKEQLRHKVMHDKIHKAKNFNIGDRVRVYNPVNQPGKSFPNLRRSSCNQYPTPWASSSMNEFEIILWRNLRSRNNNYWIFCNTLFS